MSKNATIIAFRDLDLLHFVEDVTPIEESDLENLLVWAGPRQFLEEYPVFRQLIPYVVVKKDDMIFRFQRAAAGNEARLHGKISVGIGGHVDLQDAVLKPDGSIDLLATIWKSTLREIAEEIGITVTTDMLKIVGVIRANHLPVDQHHLAVIVVCDLTGPDIVDLDFEDTLANARFDTIKNIIADPTEKETWTALALNVLAG